MKTNNSIFTSDMLSALLIQNTSEDVCKVVCSGKGVTLKFVNKPF